MAVVTQANSRQFAEESNSQTSQSEPQYGHIAYWAIFGVAAFMIVGYILQLALGVMLGLIVTVALCVLAGVFPVTYLAYSRANDETQIKRLKKELGLLGLLGEFDTPDKVGDLYRRVYNNFQYTLYVTLVVIVSLTVLVAFVTQATSWEAVNALLGMSSGAATKSTDLPFAHDLFTLVFVGFLGAYTYSIQEVVRRYNTMDLLPQVYASILVRMLVAMALIFVGASAISAFGGTTPSGAAESSPGYTAVWGPAIVAFIIGTFPTRGIQCRSRFGLTQS
jgi:hypothetical protein